MTGLEFQEVIPETDIHLLTDAFHSFGETTRKLQEAYSRLERKVASVDRELEETNRKLNRKVIELDNLTNYLNNILESMTSGVIAVNRQGEITTFNKAAQKITAFKADEVLGKPCIRVFREEEGSTCSLMRILETGQVQMSIEKDIFAKGGRPVPVEANTSLIKDRDGRTMGAVEIFWDLSEIRELENQMRQTDKLAALGEMAARVAHEIRTPLSSIEGFASLLERDLKHDGSKRKLAKNIVKGSRNLNNIVTNLLVYTKPVRLNLQREELTEIIEESLSFLTEESKEKEIRNIDITRDYRHNSRKVKVDAGQIKQVFLNLLFNAVQAMPKGGSLTIATRVTGDRPQVRGKDLMPGTVYPVPEGKFMEISFIDTGGGIPRDELDKVFSPFFTTRENGTGLGLAIAHKIVESHGGRMKVRSELSRGTTFDVILPAG